MNGGVLERKKERKNEFSERFALLSLSRKTKGF